MPFLIATPIIIVLAAAGIVGFAAFQFSHSEDPPSADVLGVSESPSITPSPESSPSASPSVDPTPSGSNPWSVDYTLPSPLRSVLNPSQQTSPSPKPAAPASNSLHNQNQGEVDIRFTNLPSSVRSGQSFTIAWQVVAPEATSGSNTTLKVVRQSNQQSGSSNSNSNSTSSQSFGVFTTPAEFDADFKFSGDPGDIEVEVSATVGGKTITKQTTINFES